MLFSLFFHNKTDQPEVFPMIFISNFSPVHVFHQKLIFLEKHEFKQTADPALVL